MNKFFTVKEAGLILGYSTNTVYKLLKEGRLKAARGSALQGRFRITKTSLEDFLKVKLPEDPLASIRIETPINMQSKKEFEPDTLPQAKTVHAADPAPPSGHPTLTRAIVIIGLFLLILDLFISNNFSLPQQGLRLLIMGVIIILTYQSGTLSSPKSR
jgi:excisionase family DNA binding protein